MNDLIRRCDALQAAVGWNVVPNDEVYTSIKNFIRSEMEDVEGIVCCRDCKKRETIDCLFYINGRDTKNTDYCYEGVKK